MFEQEEVGSIINDAIDDAVSNIRDGIIAEDKKVGNGRKRRSPVPSKKDAQKQTLAKRFKFDYPNDKPDVDDCSELSENELDEYIVKEGVATTESIRRRFQEKIKQNIINNVNQFVAQLEDGKGRLEVDIPYHSLNLRNHQIEGVKKLRDVLNQGIDRGYLDCPTGTGKTILIIAYFLAMGRPRTLILESRSNLIKQTIAQFKKYFPDLDIGIFDGKTKSIGFDITVSTYQSLQAQYNKDPKDQELAPGEFDLIICDEGHNTLGQGRHDPIRQFFDKAFVIGCSATTQYNIARTGGSLASMSELFQHLIFQYSLTQAIEDEVLAPTRNILVRVDAGDFSQLRGPNGRTNEDDYNIKKLTKVFEDIKINNVSVMLYANGIHLETNERLLGKSAIVFAVGVKNSISMAQAFNEALQDHPYFKASGCQVAEAIYGELNYKTKRNILKQHQQGKIKVLICDQLCGEGYDNPNVEVVINAKPTRSVVTELQRGGRATRLMPGKPNKVAIIIDLVYPGLSDQILFYHFTKYFNSCGQRVPFSSANSNLSYEPAVTLECEPFRILSDGFKMVAKVMPATAISGFPGVDLLQIERRDLYQPTPVDFFHQPRTTPVPIFNDLAYLGEDQSYLELDSSDEDEEYTNHY
jgi:superfamily II DNA or RNA helicase